MGAVGGAFLLGLAATLVGVPSGTEDGELLPAFGWKRFSAALVGLPLGCLLGVLVALRATRRWPWAIGAPLAALGVLIVTEGVADSSGWDTYASLAVLLLPAAAFAWWVARGRSHT